MIVTANIAPISRAAKKSLESPNIHSRIREAIREIFDRIETTSPYPEFDLELDNNTLEALEKSAKTREEKELIAKAWRAVRRADLARMMKLLPECSDDDEEDDWSDAQEAQEEDAEQADSAPETPKEDSFVDNWTVVQPSEVEPQTSGTWDSPEKFEVDNWTLEENDKKWMRRVGDLQAKLLRSEDNAFGLTRELEASKEREEQMKEEMKAMGSFVLDKCYSQETELDDIQNKLQKESHIVAELMARAGFTTHALEKSRKKEAELQETVKVLEAEMEKAKESLFNYESFFVDNWTVAENELRLRSQIWELGRNLRISEEEASDLTEELKASKAREEQMKEEMKAMGSLVLDKCNSQDTQLDEIQNKLEKQSLVVKNLISEDELTTDALKKSQEKEAELQETVKILEDKLQKSHETLKAQNENLMKIAYCLSKECNKCHYKRSFLRLRALKKEKIRVAELENKEIDMEFVDAQMEFFIERLEVVGPYE